MGGSIRHESAVVNIDIIDHLPAPSPAARNTLRGDEQHQGRTPQRTDAEMMDEAVFVDRIEASWSALKSLQMSWRSLQHDLNPNIQSHGPGFEASWGPA
jgi:hypothetical protein